MFLIVFVSLVALASLPSAECQGMGPLAGNVEEPSMDFGYPGDQSYSTTAVIVKGNFVCWLGMPVGFVREMSTPIRQMLASVGVVSTPIQLQMYSELSNRSLAPVRLSVDYYVFPHGTAADTVRRLKALMYGNTMQELLQLECDRSSGTARHHVYVGEVQMEEPMTTSRTILRPYRLQDPTTTQAPGIGDGIGGDSGEVLGTGTGGRAYSAGNCEEAETACGCATMGFCAWVKRDSDDGYNCEVPSDFQSDVSCVHCPTQDGCGFDQSGLCISQIDTCACASSIGTDGPCYWNDTNFGCMDAPSNDTVSSCFACSTQSHCGPPELASVAPPQNTWIQRRTGRYIKLTFDRPMWYKGVQGDVRFQCEGNDEPFPIMMSGLGISGAVLTIDATSVSNPRNATCGLLVGDMTLRDMGHVNYPGMMGGQYSFMLGDTIDPRLSSYDPATAAKDWNGQVITLIFNEPMVFGAEFSASFYSLKDTSGDGMSINMQVADAAELKSRTTIVDNRIFINLKDLLEAETGYALELAPGTTIDTSGNQFDGVMLGAYVFTTGLAPGSIDNSPEDLVAAEAAKGSEDNSTNESKVKSIAVGGSVSRRVSWIMAIIVVTMGYPLL